MALLTSPYVGRSIRRSPDMNPGDGGSGGGYCVQEGSGIDQAR
jgi:hypothetical protein